MNKREINIICATARGIRRAEDELRTNPKAWVRAMLDVMEYLDKPLSSELCGYYGAMVKHWEDLGKPDFFT